MGKKLILLGKWTKKGLNQTLQESSAIKDTGKRIAFLSKNFLGVVYKESTLIGDINRDEVFVVNLEGVDCMTFIEYIEAMRLSGSFPEFLENLKRIRYSQGKVAFKNRNHFFTDWIESNSEFIEDVTDRIGGAKTVAGKKKLNLKPIPEGFNRGKDGEYLLPGIPSKEREIKYIPADAIDDAVLDKLKAGDYIGIYSKDDGLDVSHVGIIVKGTVPIYGEVETGMRRMGTVPVSLRHASSVVGKVVDEDFKKYIAYSSLYPPPFGGKVRVGGLVVLRPRSL